MAISLAQSLAKSLAYSLCGGDIPEPVPCTFTFSAGEHGSVSATINGVSVTSPASAMTGDLVVITATPSEHYHLTAWSDGSTQNPYSFRLRGDKTLSASFSIDTFVVTATGTHGSVSGSGTYEYNESCTLLFEPDSHYHFVEWSDGDPNNPRTFNVTENLTVSTVGILDQHTITTSAVNGTITGGGTYDYGSSVVLTFTPSSGYEFDHWSDGDTNNPRTIAVLQDATYSCTGLGQEVTISATAHYGSVTGAGTYRIGDTCTLTYTPFAHHHFVNWTDGSVENPRSFTVTGAASFEANGAIDQHTISVSATNGVASGAGTYNWGTTISISVAPNSGYKFTEWSDGNTDNPRSVTVTADASYSTTCEPEAPTFAGLKFTATGNSTISFNQQGTWSGSWPIETSQDGSTWTSYTLGTSISLSDGQYVYFRGQKDSTAQTNSNYRKFTMSGSISASGDCTSLLNGVGSVLDLTPYGNNVFYRMFYGCSSLLSSPSLPSTTLVTECYRGMFEQCSSITTTPDLPATTLKSNCYQDMFYRCESLTYASELPASYVPQYAYNYMFSRCTSLTNSPVINASVLGINSCGSMFKQCSSLINVTCNATGGYGSDSTYNWLDDVSASGDFYGKTSYGWGTGASGIPYGWTAHLD